MRRLIGSRNLLFVFLLLAIPAASFAGVGISITIAPPPLPVYAQPPCPVDGYLWTPGYWAWGTAGYYWVPGVWVAPPAIGLLWTPGYWGFVGGAYIWHAGYWGPHVGFYGGINYGFGYPGHGFYGGVWSGRAFRYNTAVVNVNRSVVHNVYTDRTFIHNTVSNRTSFNGGRGVNAAPNASERVALRDRHLPAVHGGRQFGVAANRSNVAAQHQQPARTSAMRRPAPAAQRQQPDRTNAVRHAAPSGQPRQLQASRENRGGPHAR